MLRRIRSSTAGARHPSASARVSESPLSLRLPLGGLRGCFPEHLRPSLFPPGSVGLRESRQELRAKAVHRVFNAVFAEQALDLRYLLPALLLKNPLGWLA